MFPYEQIYFVWPYQTKQISFDQNVDNIHDLIPLNNIYHSNLDINQEFFHFKIIA